MVVDPLPITWRNYEKDIISTFREFVEDGNLVDVTLACDGATFEVHKIVLSACSAYFRTLFQKNHCKHPTVIIGNVKCGDMKALVDFMYNGNVSVPKENLSDFLKTANLLQIKGLTARLEDVINDSNSTTQNNDGNALDGRDERLEPATDLAGLLVPTSSCLVNSEDECSEVSVRTDDESECTEAVAVKNEPEDTYNKLPAGSYVERSSPLIPNTESLEGRLNAEQRKPSSASEIYQFVGPVCNARASVSSEASSRPVVLSESIASGQGGHGIKPQAFPYIFGEPQKEVQGFAFNNTGHLPSGGKTFGSTSINTLSERGEGFGNVAKTTGTASPTFGTAITSTSSFASTPGFGNLAAAATAGISFGLGTTTDSKIPFGTSGSTPIGSSSGFSFSQVGGSATTTTPSLGTKFGFASAKFSFGSIARMTESAFPSFGTSITSTPSFGFGSFAVPVTSESSFGLGMNVTSTSSRFSFGSTSTVPSSSLLSNGDGCSRTTTASSFGTGFKFGSPRFSFGNVTKTTGTAFSGFGTRPSFGSSAGFGNLATGSRSLFSLGTNTTTTKGSELQFGNSGCTSIASCSSFGQVGGTTTTTSSSGTGFGFEPQVVLERVPGLDTSVGKEMTSSSSGIPTSNILSNGLQEVSGTSADMESQKNDIPSSLCESFDPDYDCKCARQCAGKIPSTARSDIFRKFWSLENCAQQSAFIRNTVFEEDVAYKQKEKHMRYSKRIYNLGGIVVCYQMYVNTLKIKTKRINQALETTRFHENRIRRRSHSTAAGRSRLPETKLREVICYLERFFDCASHNNNNNNGSTGTMAEFSNHSMRGLYTGYKQHTASPVTYYHFSKIFRDNFMSCARGNGKAINSALKSHKGLAKGTEPRMAEQSDSNTDKDQQQAAVSNKQFPITAENVPHSLGTGCDYKVISRQCFSKLTAGKVKKAVDHFNKLFHRTSQWDKGNGSLSNSDLWQMYKTYKKEVVDPVSFTTYIKIFNLNFRQSNNEDSAKQTIQHSNAENSIQDCSANEISREQLSHHHKQTGLMSSAADRTGKVIKHFYKFYDDPSLYKRLGFSTKNFVPPLQKMYEIYKKDVAVPVSFDQYVDIYHTSFKSFLSEINANRAVKDPATKNPKAVQSNSKKTGGQQRNIKVGQWQRFSALPPNKIEEVTEHLDKFYNIPSKYKKTGFSVKSIDPQLRKTYKIYKESVILPVKFHHYTKIFYTCFRDTLSKRNQADKAQSHKANVCATHADQREEQLEGSQVQNLDQEKAGTVNKSSACYPKANSSITVSTVNTVNPIQSALEDEVTKNIGMVSQTTKIVGDMSFDDLSSARIEEAIDHFKEFYAFVSCHNEANVPLEFVNNNLPLKKMYELYRAEVIEPVSYHQFIHIFHVNFKCSEDHSKAKSNKINEVGKNSSQNAEVSSLSQNEPISSLQTCTGSQLQSDIYEEVNFQNAVIRKADEECPSDFNSRGHIVETIAENLCTSDEESRQESDNISTIAEITTECSSTLLKSNVKFQNAVVVLSRIGMPLEFQKRPPSSKADERCPSGSDSKQDLIETIAESICTSDKDSRQESVNTNMVAESTTVCNSKSEESLLKSNIELPCISSTQGCSRSGTLNDDDDDNAIASKLLAEMIEIIECNSMPVDEMNCIADENIDDLSFSKDMDITTKDL